MLEIIKSILVRETVHTNNVDWNEVSRILQAAAAGGRQQALEELLEDNRFSRRTRIK